MNLKRIYFSVLLLLLSSSGCAILGNLDEVFTLQAYSNEKDAQHRQVNSTNAHYDALILAIDQGHIHDYKDEASFVHAFGEPILKKDLTDGTQRWLYRHAIYRLSKDKVYLFFDRNNHLIKWERLPCPKFF